MIPRKIGISISAMAYRVSGLHSESLLSDFHAEIQSQEVGTGKRGIQSSKYQHEFICIYTVQRIHTGTLSIQFEVPTCEFMFQALMMGQNNLFCHYMGSLQI